MLRVKAGDDRIVSLSLGQGIFVVSGYISLIRPCPEGFLFDNVMGRVMLSPPLGSATAACFPPGGGEGGGGGGGGTMVGVTGGGGGTQASVARG